MTIDKKEQHDGENGSRIQNPFMIRSSENYGINLDELKMANEILNKKDKSEVDFGEISEGKNKKQQFDMSFLYTRESDRIGESVQLSDTPLAKQFREKPQRRKRNKCLIDENGLKEEPQTLEQVNAILESWKQAPKSENPLYTTSANDVGIKKVSLATYTANRYPRNQSFSNSFNRTMFRDHGLNTARTKSNVLDHQFV